MYQKRLDAAKENIDYIEKKYEGIKNNPRHALYKNYLSAKKDAESNFEKITNTSYGDYKKGGNASEKPEEGKKPNADNKPQIVLSVNSVELEAERKKLETANSNIIKQEEEIQKLKNTIDKNKEGKDFVSLYDNLFGEKDSSIRNILLGIAEAIDEEAEILKKNQKTTTSGKTAGVKNTDLDTINNANSGGTLIANAALQQASSSSIKNIQVKQTLYLKAIAEATLDSATVLKYIGRNLIFDRKGLFVYQNGSSASGGDVFTEMTDINGKKIDTTGKTTKVFGF
jgi:hypothetical protein